MFNISILSPLSQFEVTSLLSLNAPILGYIHISLTNLSLYTIFILFIVVGLHYYGNNDYNLKTRLKSKILRIKQLFMIKFKIKEFLRGICGFEKIFKMKIL